MIQILEEGSVTYSSGRAASFKNCVIILTGNIGSDLTKKSNTVGFGASANAESYNSEKIRDQAKKLLKPELINRVESLIIFNNFKEEDIKTICKLELEKLIRRTSDKINKLSFSSGLVNHLQEEALKYDDGARPIKNLIKRLIENRLAEKLLSLETSADIKISVTCRNKKINFSIKEVNK